MKLNGLFLFTAFLVVDPCKTAKVSEIRVDVNDQLSVRADVSEEQPNLIFQIEILLEILIQSNSLLF